MALRHRSRRVTRGTGRGFTLVELLTVVAIVALLLALLTPTLGRARELTRRAACKSVLQQQLLGVAQYAVNHAGKLLPGYRYATSPSHVHHDEPWVLNTDTYRSYRDAYLGNNDRMFTCPNMDALSFPRLHFQGGAIQVYLLGFNYNGNKPGLNDLTGSSFPVGRLDSKEARTVPLFSDLNNWSTGFGRTMVAHTARGGMGDIYGFGADAFEAGSEGGNYGYADGHVIWQGLGTLQVIRAFAGPGISPGWDLLPDDAW